MGGGSECQHHSQRPVFVCAAYADALLNPIAYISQLEKHAQQLEILTEDFESDVSSVISVTGLMVMYNLYNLSVHKKKTGGRGGGELVIVSF